MGKFSNWFLTGFAALFLIPSTLVMISWNAIPGDSLYSLKTGLEDVLLTSISGTALASSVSVKYTERRFDEAVTLLDKKGSTAGYTLLVEEAKDSQKIITKKQDIKQKQELVAKIESYKKEIVQKQVAIQSGEDHVPVAANTPTQPVPTKKPNVFTKPKPTETPIPTTTTAVPTMEPTKTRKTKIEVVQAKTEEEVIKNLEDVLWELEEIQEEIEIQLPEQASERAQQNAQERAENSERRYNNNSQREQNRDD